MLQLFGDTFTSWKAALPALAPFAWDAALMRASAALHGGTPPWRWLHPVLGHPPVTAALDRAYALWFGVMAAVLGWQALSRPSPLRARFFVCFLLGWALLGTGLAALFPSAGPCYFGRVAGGLDPYEPLMRYLRRVDRVYPLTSLAAQRWLWEQYRAGNVEAGSGISALPSMHVAMATLFALRGWRSSRALGLVLTAFAAVIFAGSVHLGWHYAVDGYLSAALMAALWYAVGRWQSRPQALPARA